MTSVASTGITAPEQVVQRQLDAYNAHDAATFVSFYRDPCLVTDQDEVASERTHAALLAASAKLLVDHPDLHCDVATRIVSGEWVVDEEILHGFGSEPVRAIAVYRVRDGLIVEFRVLR